MSAMSDYLENKIIDWLLRGQAYTPPATAYVGLYTAAPSDAALEQMTAEELRELIRRREGGDANSQFV